MREFIGPGRAVQFAAWCAVGCRNNESGFTADRDWRERLVETGWACSGILPRSIGTERMAAPIVHLLAVFLLVAQGLVGIAPGRVLCVAIWPHAGCEHSVEVGCGGHGHRVHTHRHIGLSPGRSDQSPVSHQILPPHEECSCHVHVPVPGDPQSPRGQGQSGDRLEMRLTAAAALAVAGGWDCVPTTRGMGPERPPGCLGMERAVSIRSTRLRI